ncbi:triphosphoribosyl-dephospho-CoA synthase [Azohydromonas caseinilytica]|uniref:Triphosphoribosyl-dephospho-CoA synthase n=1 Tax=Azohydromonas caseinilytica TaxID=2728836 RepID=A0A848F8D8_9BURK|nr:triphosphoribosyl-dephospho-CoA synthase [Azohydromonas caseinilytica]NML15824.1 triphosphoribosyl-dephospho-CoA synthase [Azohydromonas caseinilytica]
MTEPSSPPVALTRARAAFLAACRLDVEVRKPGNVSVFSAGHGMQARQFLDSAAAAQEALFAPGLSVGRRIEGAVRATLAVAGCNTNLGIVLLCAPIAAAVERAPHYRDAEELHAAVRDVLRGLDIEDAAHAFRGIAAANPGGLGRAEAQDVKEAPTLDLRAAMALAAERDSIARQYAQGFDDLFHTGLPAFRAGANARDGMLRAWLAFLARWPDSHIVRKHGAAVAQTVLRRAAEIEARLRQEGPAALAETLAAWDEALKSRGINPGTSADLAVATALLAGLAGGGTDRD